ncbi:hypothetical protein ACOMHN_038318 [Nucella lapillus]
MISATIHHSSSLKRIFSAQGEGGGRVLYDLEAGVGQLQEEGFVHGHVHVLGRSFATHQISQHAAQVGVVQQRSHLLAVAWA